jgi:hypothetical protein
MRRFIIFMLLVLAGVQEGRAYVIYTVYTRGVDQPRNGYSNTHKSVMYVDVPFTLGALQFKVVSIRCSGSGHEECPTQVAQGDLQEIFDAPMVNTLVNYFETALGGGQGSGSHTIHYADSQSGKTYVYRVDWFQENGQTKMTINKSELVL